jgi:parallel beta-helix repeat protein
MKNKGLLLTLLTVFLSLVFIHSWAFAASYYVSTNGNNAYNGRFPAYEGGSNGPKKNINDGIALLGPSDTLYIRGGTYTETVYISTDGSPDAYITISSYPGETAVIDGYDAIPPHYWGTLFTVDGDYVRVRDLEVKNSLWMGLVARGAHDEIVNVHSHGHWENGILISGDFSLVDSCYVYYNCKSNANCGNTRGNWASGLSAARHPAHATIRDCRVWNNWGEGLSTYEATYTTIEDNIVYDNSQPNVYLSDTTNTLLQRNIVYSTPGNICNCGAQIGIAMSNEKRNPASRDNTVINNFVMGCKRNFYWWRDALTDGLINVVIAYNTFVNSSYEVNFKVADGNHRNTRICSNIFLQEDSLPVVNAPRSFGITWSHNNWSKPPDSDANGIGDVVGDALLARSGPNGAGSLTAQWFKILAGSPARDHAVVINEVIEDFF